METIKVAGDDQCKKLWIQKHQYSIGSALKVCGLKENEIDQVFTKTLQVFKEKGYYCEDNYHGYSCPHSAPSFGNEMFSNWIMDPVYASKSDDNCIAIYSKQESLYVNTRPGADISDLTIIAADNFVNTFLSVSITLVLLILMLLPISKRFKK